MRKKPLIYGCSVSTFTGTTPLFDQYHEIYGAQGDVRGFQREKWPTAAIVVEFGTKYAHIGLRPHT